MIRRPIAVALLFVSAGVALADDPPKPAASGKESKTKHEATIGGKKVEYEATAGTLTIKDDDGKPLANIFHIAYTKTGEDAAKRPVTFCFNGGPGSSSVWLHMGAFGPRRVAMNDEGDAATTPARLVDNDDSLLDLTDLVFIDPVSTGYSRPAEGKDAKAFHGVQEDVSSVGEFIRLWTTQNKRWKSPKFVAGESYGTTRASSLAGYMQSKHGLRFNGVLLVSAVLNFGTIRFDEGNDLPYPLFLPTYTATAFFHKKLSSELQKDLKETVAEAEKFAAGEYATALHKGASLTDAERKEVAAKVAKYTGLSEQFVLRNDLRVEGQRFMRELLRDRGRTTGRYDARLLGKDGNDAAERPDYDPSYSAVQGAYTEAFNTYVRDELKYESDQAYEILTGRVNPWNYATATNHYLNVAPTLKSAMAQNPDLRVYVANGYYDLATPFAATKYTFNHMSSDRGILDRVTMGYYEAGHMMYIHKPSADKLKKDIAAFMSGK